MSRRVDSITFEVLRHRLWAINDEAGAAIRHNSGSTIATESYDFNTGLMTGRGDSVVVGVYISGHASVLDLIVKDVLREYAENPGIGPDDMFLCNDPYVGALHQPDVGCVAPVFHRGEVIAWCGNTVHQVDVGGPVPGGFTVGARSIFQEPLPMPPIRIVEGGRLRKDLEREYLRRSRAPQLVALDLRAQIAANNVAKARLLEVIEAYGLETVRAVMEEMIDYVEARFRARLQELPDGVWEHVGFIEHDGVEERCYRCHLRLTKIGDRLVFDLTESDQQAPGLINAAFGAMRGGIVAAILTELCYDLPWTPAALWRCIEIESKPGTVMHAAWPAGVSMASIAGGRCSAMLANVCIGKMLSASARYRDHAMAAWEGSGPYSGLYGLNQRGEPFGTLIIDSLAGGAGARRDKDGVDTAGPITAIAAGIANVETNEYNYPVLFLYRRTVRDSGGPGRTRGGAGIEYAVVPHRTAEPLEFIMFGHGALQPASGGICGGYPAGMATFVVGRATRVWNAIREGAPLGDVTRLGGHLTLMPPMADTFLQGDDVFAMQAPGGGGYGDPLDRQPDRVARDVAELLVSPEAGFSIYGVVLASDGRPDLPRTARRRQLLRARRAASGRWVVGREHAAGRAEVTRLPEGIQAAVLREGLLLARTAEGVFQVCDRCRAVLAGADANYKLSVPCRETPIRGRRRGPVPPRSAVYVRREYFCPGCGVCLDVEVNVRGAPPVWELRRRTTDDGRPTDDG